MRHNTTYDAVSRNSKSLSHSLTALQNKLMVSCLIDMHSPLAVTDLPGCISQQAAAMALGYTQVSWDNESGEEQQPLASFLSWAALTDEEKAAGTLLRYTATSWDNLSGSEVVDKSWRELTSCPDG